VSTQSASAGGAEPRHGRNIALIWLVATAIVEPLTLWVVGPHIPPIRVSSATGTQHAVDVAMTCGAVPVLLLVWVVFGYSIRNFRHRGGALVDGPPLRSNSRIQIVWLAVSGLLVLALAITGTADLWDNAGAGAGEGATPLNKPGNMKDVLPVQVIGQQWVWTFRYPTYGGVETPTLEIPVGRQIEFHVTSLDVVHSFWAIELGVKADAVPGADNVAFVRAYKDMSFQVRCAELCGLWHGHMNTTGYVVSPSKFSSWIAAQQTKYAAVTKQLPKYSTVYYPQPVRNGG
jgi:cytochrome c oxidase subunit 2